MNILIRKIKSQSGESIAETLVALLISALALVMLAGAISTAARVIMTSDRKMADYYTQDAVLVARGSGTDTTVSITKPGAATATETKTVTYYTNNAFATKHVVSYVKKNMAAGG